MEKPYKNKYLIIKKLTRNIYDGYNFWILVIIKKYL